MTSPFEDPAAQLVDHLQVEVRLCADGTATLLDRERVPDAQELIEFVLGRYGLPEAVLRDESVGDLAPVGWVVPAPESVGTRGSVHDTPCGQIRTPDGYIEVRPVLPGFGFKVESAMPALLASPVAASALATAGLLDAAGDDIPGLWDKYRATFGADDGPTPRVGALLSIHRRARSAGAMALAAHVVDTAGEVLHRTGVFGAAVELHRWALGVCSRDRLDVDRAVALTHLSHALWHDGSIDAAVEAGDLALRVAVRVGDVSLVQRASMTVAYPLADQGEPAVAAVIMANTSAPDGGLALGWWHHALAYVALASGHVEAADEHVRAALTPGYGRDGRQDQRESLLAESFTLAAAIAGKNGDDLAAAMADANADIARGRMPAPYTH